MSDHAVAAPQPTPSASAQSYAKILHSTAVIGVSFVAVVVLSFIRMKVMAVLLGPAGVGMIGLFSSVLDLAVVIVGLGLQQSGVRQIAQAQAGDGNVARVATALFWTSIVLGVAGALLLALLSVPISIATFGTAQYGTAIVLVGGALLLRLISGGQLALIQGTRRIADLARINIFSAMLSTAVCVPVIYLWREQAVAPSVVIIAASTTLVAYCYARSIAPITAPSLKPIYAETGALLRLGLVFMASGLLTMGVAYLVRIVILHAAGIHAAGLYQAAWTVAALYTGFVLQAMGSDFYPRLTSLAKDDAACNCLVNEQIRISILLAGPGVMATITLAPLVLSVFYATEFGAAAEALRWICLGTMLQTMTWPIGFILLAKGARRAFFWMEVAAAAVHITLVLLLVPRFGMNGAGMAFCGLYVWYGVAIFAVARSVSGFTWGADNLRLAFAYLALIGTAFVGMSVLPMVPATILGLVLSMVSGLYSLRAIIRLVTPEGVPAMFRPWLSRLGYLGR